MNPPPEHPTTRRILLPSGRTIEVIRYATESQSSPGLHVCPECGSDLVHPIQWREAAQGFWELTLRCPNCRRIEEGVFDQDQVDALEERLDNGLTDMLSDLRRLTRSNMVEEIARFTAALEADFLLPEDF